jgi:hypothetical protein
MEAFRIAVGVDKYGSLAPHQCMQNSCVETEGFTVFAYDQVYSTEQMKVFFGKKHSALLQLVRARRKLAPGDENTTISCSDCNNQYHSACVADTLSEIVTFNCPSFAINNDTKMTTRKIWQLCNPIMYSCVDPVRDQELDIWGDCFTYTPALDLKPSANRTCLAGMWFRQDVFLAMRVIYGNYPWMGICGISCSDHCTDPHKPIPSVVPVDDVTIVTQKTIFEFEMAFSTEEKGKKRRIRHSKMESKNIQTTLHLTTTIKKRKRRIEQLSTDNCPFVWHAPDCFCSRRSWQALSKLHAKGWIVDPWGPCDTQQHLG